MKLNERERFVVVDTPNEAVQFTIAPGARAFHLLLDKIYTDKPLAVVREAAQNAWDAHAAAGVTDPIVVTLPTRAAPVLTVKDVGVGMSGEFMMSGYCSLTHSTKNDSDASVGGYGIGRLSMLSICDTYTIKTSWEGVRREYVVLLDKDRMPTLTMTREYETDELGTEVSIPVTGNTVEKMLPAAQKALHYFPKGSVTLVNGELTHTKYLYEDEQFAVINGNTGPFVVMGPMAYPFNKQRAGREVPEMDALPFRIELRCPIGTVDIAPNREDLDYTPRTMAALRDMTEAAHANVTHYVNETIMKPPSVLDKRRRLENMYKTTLVPYNTYMDIRSDIEEKAPDVDAGFYARASSRSKGFTFTTMLSAYVSGDQVPMDKLTVLRMDKKAPTRYHQLVAIMENTAEAERVIIVKSVDEMGWSHVKQVASGATFGNVEDYVHLLPTAERPQSKAPPCIYEYPRKPGATVYSLEQLKQFKADGDNFAWVQVKQGKLVKAPVSNDVLDGAPLTTAIITMMRSRTDPFSVYTVPASHKEAVRWCSVNVPSILECLLLKAHELWNDPAIRIELVEGMKAYNVDIREAGKALPRYHLCTKATDIPPSLFADLVQMVMKARAYNNNTHRIAQVLLIRRMLPAAKTFIAAYTSDTTRIPELLRNARVRYPLIDDLVTRKALPGIPTDVVINYIKFIEEIRNDRTRHNQNIRLAHDGTRGHDVPDDVGPPELGRSDLRDCG